MKKIDLLGAFKTGTERGLSAEQIKQTLFNAGYDAQDVEDSFQAYSRGESPYIKPTAKPLPVIPQLRQPGKPMPVQVQAPLPSLPSAMPQAMAPVKKKMSQGLLIGIIATSVLMVIALGFIILSAFSN